MRKYIGFLAISVFLASSIYAQNMQKEHRSKGCKSKYCQAIKKGNRASKILLKTLKSNLKKSLKKGKIDEALKFCATNAAKLTGEVNNKLEKGVSVKRVSLKPRNPANEANSEEKKVLEALEILNKEHVKLPRFLIQEKENEYIYYKPLVIKKGLCLKCHGTNIAPTLAKKIKEYYPTDKATGYKMGDLRGAVVVTIKK